MLSHEPDNPRDFQMLGKAGFADSSGGPQLDLTPPEIVIHVDVDARFVAE
jgi:hypothetical protein